MPIQKTYGNRLPNNQYFFSTEGETEGWYLDWLQHVIGQSPAKHHTAKITHQVCKDPYKFAKGRTNIEKLAFWHLHDRESEDAVHTGQFHTMLERLEKCRTLPWIQEANLGYSNFTFELWMVLHKEDLNTSLGHRDRYLAFINRAFGERFETLDQYKHEDNFKRLLRGLTIEHVRDAITRSERIMQCRQAEHPHLMQTHAKYTFCIYNPSLTIHLAIKKILSECGLM